MNKYIERIYNGIWKENPIFVQMLGLCPTLAVTTSAINGLGMGLSTTAVLVAANILIAAAKTHDHTILSHLPISSFFPLQEALQFHTYNTATSIHSAITITSRCS